MKYNLSKFKNKKVKKLLPALVLATLLIGSGIYLYSDRNKTTRVEDQITAVDTDGIDYGPPSEELVKGTEEHKANLGNNSSASAAGNNGSGKKAVTPFISYAGYSNSNVEINSYVNGIVENGGTCTLTLTNGSQKVTKQVTGEKDANTTLCPQFVVSGLAIGEWTATVTYNSATAEGISAKSNPIKVE